MTRWSKESGAMEQIPVRSGVPAKHFWTLWKCDRLAHGSRTPCWSMLILGTSQSVMSQEQPFFCYFHLYSSKQPGVMTCPGLRACLWMKCWDCEVLVFCDWSKSQWRKKATFPPHPLSGDTSLIVVPFLPPGRAQDLWAVCIPGALVGRWRICWDQQGGYDVVGPLHAGDPSKQSCVEKKTSWWHCALVLPEAACATGSPEPYSLWDLGKREPFLGPLKQAQLGWGIWKTQACTPLLCSQIHRTGI